MFRQGERTETSIIQDLSRRVKDLEYMASRRVLPPGFEFTYDPSTEQLLVRRVSDGATVVLL